MERLRCFGILFNIFLLLQFGSPTLEEIGACDCGIFHSLNLSQPIFVRRINYNMCGTPFSRIMCNELCVSLNTGSIDVDITLICDIIKNGVNVFMRIFSKMCEDSWMDTNLIPADAICCENGNDIPCEE